MICLSKSVCQGVDLSQVACIVSTLFIQWTDFSALGNAETERLSMKLLPKKKIKNKLNKDHERERERERERKRERERERVFCYLIVWSCCLIRLSAVVASCFQLWSWDMKIK